MITSTGQTGEVQRSHRVIEKKRRDKINTCLAQLTRAVPAAYAKQTSGKLEKAEILEMTVQYLQALEASTCRKASEISTDSSIYYQSGYEECMQAVATFLPSLSSHPTYSARTYRLLSHLRACSPAKPPTDGGALFRQRPAQTLITPPHVPAPLGCTLVPSGTRCSAFDMRAEQCTGNQNRCVIDAGRYQTMEQLSSLQTTLSQLGPYGHGYYGNYNHAAVHSRFLPYHRGQGLSRCYQSHIL